MADDRVDDMWARNAMMSGGPGRPNEVGDQHDTDLDADLAWRLTDAERRKGSRYPVSGGGDGLLFDQHAVEQIIAARMIDSQKTIATLRAHIADMEQYVEADRG